MNPDILPTDWLVKVASKDNLSIVVKYGNLMLTLTLLLLILLSGLVKSLPLSVQNSSYNIDSKESKGWYYKMKYHTNIQHIKRK